MLSIRYTILFLFAIIIFAACKPTTNATTTTNIAEAERPAPKPTPPTPPAEPAPKAEPTLYKSKDGNYSIMFPGTPNEQRQTIPLEGYGNIEMIATMYEPSPDKIYMVAYADYPKEIVAKANKANKNNVSELIQNAKQGAIGKLKLNISSEQIAMLGKHKGIAFTADNGNNMHTSYNIFLVDNRLYQLAILSQKGAITPDDAKDFLASFQLLK
jgi:hypothetical protein